MKINLLIFLTPHIVPDPIEHRSVSLRQRDKLQAFMREHRFRNLRHEQLDTPSWDPALPPPTPKEGEEGYVDTGAGEGDSGDRRPLTEPADEEPLPPTTYAQPAYTQQPASQVDMGRDLEPPIVNRYVLLAPFGERGQPPPGLQSTSGLISVVLPEQSTLVHLFVKGGRYRYTSDTFEGLYQCLEAYPGPQEALMIYPEGLPVDPTKGEYLHWRDIGNDWSSNSAAWSILN